MAKRKYVRREYGIGRRHNIGLAWFRPEDYSQILKIVEQPRDLSGDYNQWLEKTEGTERYWKRRGFLVVRVVVDPEKFLAWCSARSVEPNGDALGRFVQLRTQSF
jgi:hypothetical protein